METWVKECDSLSSFGNNYFLLWIFNLIYISSTWLLDMCSIRMGPRWVSLQSCPFSSGPHLDVVHVYAHDLNRRMMKVVHEAPDYSFEIETSEAKRGIKEKKREITSKFELLRIIFLGFQTRSNLKIRMIIFLEISNPSPSLLLFAPNKVQIWLTLLSILFTNQWLYLWVIVLSFSFQSFVSSIDFTVSFQLCMICLVANEMSENGRKGEKKDF